VIRPLLGCVMASCCIRDSIATTNSRTSPRSAALRGAGSLWRGIMDFHGRQDCLNVHTLRQLYHLYGAGRNCDDHRGEVSESVAICVVIPPINGSWFGIVIPTEIGPKPATTDRGKRGGPTAPHVGAPPPRPSPSWNDAQGTTTDRCRTPPKIGMPRSSAARGDSTSTRSGDSRPGCLQKFVRRSGDCRGPRRWT
jgi:hypothetical protein